MNQKKIKKSTPDLSYAIEKGKGHYGIEDETEALLQLLVRSVGHAEQDDHKQDVEIQNLKNSISKLENLMKSITSR